MNRNKIKKYLFDFKNAADDNSENFTKILDILTPLTSAIDEYNPSTAKDREFKEKMSQLVGELTTTLNDVIGTDTKIVKLNTELVDEFLKEK